MRAIIITTMLAVVAFMTTLLSGRDLKAQPAQYFRVFQGFKRADLTRKQLLLELPTFMKDTVELYQEKALSNYMVVIPPANKPDYIPDELALVALTSEKIYRDIRSTEKGKQYSARHWDIFDQETSFSSQKFVDFQRERPSFLENNATYDMIGEAIDWSEGYSLIYVGTRQDSITREEFLNRLHSHIQLAKNTLNPLGMQAYIVLANENFEVAYINWSSKEDHDAAFAKEETKIVFQDASTMLDRLMYQPLEPLAAGQSIEFGGSYSTVVNGEPVK